MSIGGLMGGLAGGIGLAAGVGNVSAPSGRNMSSELQNTLASMLTAAPGELSAEQTYQPAYTDLQGQDLLTALLGNNGVLSTMGAAQPAITSVNTGAATGLASELGTAGPQIMSAWRQSNPQLAQTLDQINKLTQGGLNAGSTLGPDLTRTLGQQFTASQAQRGLGTGTGDAALQAYYMAQQGNNLLQQRLGNASSAASLTAGVQPNLLSLLTSTNAANASSLIGTAGGVANNAGPKMFNPMNQYAEDAYNTNYNANAAANISTANNQAAILGGIMGSAKGSSGSGASAAGCC